MADAGINDGDMAVVDRKLLLIPVTSVAIVDNHHPHELAKSGDSVLKPHNPTFRSSAPWASWKSWRSGRLVRLSQ
jgi:SOS-response transcriptional repressor LexA